MTYTGLFNNLSINENCLADVRINPGEKQNVLRSGDVIFTGSSETPDEVAYSSVMTKSFNEDVYLNSFCIGYRACDGLLLPEYAKHLFRCKYVRKQLVKTAMGVTRFNVSKERLKRVRIYIPPIEAQRDIASILDKFSTMTISLIDGLPAEIKLRRQQYEYYRDKLLSFSSDH